MILIIYIGNWMDIEVQNYVYFFNFFNKFHLFLRERQCVCVCVSRGGSEREGDTELRAGSRLRAVSMEPDAGLEPTNRETTT